MQWPLVGREAALSQVFELVESGTGVAILGPAGVGKSRLLHELADRAERSGKAVVTAVASEATRSIPFAPFVELLEGPTQDKLSMLGAARRSLQATSGARGSLVVVDDAHHLDETSLAFLISTVNSGIATVALTARTGEPMAADLVDLWTNGVIQRMDVAPLDRGDARTLLEEALGRISDPLEDELWRLARGNPLILHELVEGAVDSAIIKKEDAWVLAGPVAESPRLGDLVTSRLRAIPDQLRPAMDAVAVGSPLPWPLAIEAIGDDLAALEDRGLVDSSGRDSDRLLIPAHPLYGEILKANLGGTRTRAAYKRLVEAANRLEVLSDPLRVALWQRELGEISSPHLAIAGAQAALVRHEPGLAEELLRPLGTENDLVAVLLGRAVSYQQRFEEAEALLAPREPSDQALMAEIASIRAQNLGFGLGRVADARQLLHEAAERMEDPDLRARLINERAMVSAIHGDFEDSMASSDQVLSDPATSDVSRAAAYVTLTVALAMTGDCARMDEVVDGALEVAARARDVLPFAHDQVGVMRMSSALHAGRIYEAHQFCSDALDGRDPSNAMTTTWLASSVMAYELSGRLVDARAAAEEALRFFKRADPFGLEAQAEEFIGLISGQMGVAIGSDSFRLDHPQAGPRLTVWLNRGRAWSAAARGDPEGAAQIAAQGGREALDGEHYAWAAFCFSDAVRFGHADLVVDYLRAIDSSKGAYLVDAIKQYGEAAAMNDAEYLKQVGERFLGFGTVLLAAETLAQAAVGFEKRGSEAEATISTALSMAAEARCQGPQTPALAVRPTIVSNREIEVALDAASGMTSPQISEKRFISVRTVDNHLSSVYRKLGLSGRGELSDLFSPVASPSENE